MLWVRGESDLACMSWNPVYCSEFTDLWEVDFSIYQIMKPGSRDDSSMIHPLERGAEVHFLT